MTKYETPRDAEGRRLCEHCQKTPVPESLGTKPRRYCSRNCRQRAYEARKVREAIVTSVAVAVARDRKSRDLEASERAKTRDFPKPQAAPGVPAPTAPGGDFLLAPPQAPARPVPGGGMPPPPPGARRRRLLPPPPGASRDAPTLFDDQGEPDAQP